MIYVLWVFILIAIVSISCGIWDVVEDYLEELEHMELEFDDEEL